MKMDGKLYPEKEKKDNKIIVIIVYLYYFTLTNKNLKFLINIHLLYKI